MRFVVVLILLAAAFFVGRATDPVNGASAAATKTYPGTVGDVFVVRRVAARCRVDQEAAVARMICSHTPTARYSVVFYRDNVFVYRNGKPDNPVFSAAGHP